MKTNDVLHIIVGIMIMVTVALGYYMNPWWFAFTFFIGANLLQSGFTKFCLMAIILRKLGCKD